VVSSGVPRHKPQGKDISLLAKKRRKRRKKGDRQVVGDGTNEGLRRTRGGNEKA